MAQVTTDAGLLRVLDMLQQDLTHIGVQDGTMPAQTATKLNGEFFRRPVIDPITDGFTLVADAYFEDGEAEGDITAWGIFGDGAGEALNSGTLFAATAANINKVGGESLTLSAEITVRRAGR